MILEQLRVFVAVAERQHVMQAASTCCGTGNATTAGPPMP